MVTNNQDLEETFWHTVRELTW